MKATFIIAGLMLGVGATAVAAAFVLKKVRGIDFEARDGVRRVVPGGYSTHRIAEHIHSYPPSYRGYRSPWQEKGTRNWNDR